LPHGPLPVMTECYGHTRAAAIIGTPPAKSRRSVIGQISIAVAS
jgi:hypothetical protein